MLNDETAIMDKLVTILKQTQWYNDTNIAIGNFNMLNAGVEYGVILTENTINNVSNAPYAYMSAGQSVIYTFIAQVLRKQNRKDDELIEHRNDIRRVRTIIDANPTLDNEVINCRVTSVGLPSYYIRDGNGPYYRYRDLTIEVKIIEELDLTILTPVPTPLLIPGD